MNNHKTIPIGHRGAAAVCPENTLESFRIAFEEHGAEMIEFDLHLSKEGIPVVIHDETLERTTNGSGLVAAHTLQELRSLDAGFNFDPDNNQSFPWRGKDLTIPTLDEVFERFPDKALALEIKSTCPETVNRILAVVQKYQAESRVIIGSLHDGIYREIRDKQRSFRIFTSKREAQRLYFQYLTGQKSHEQRPDLVASLPVKTRFFDLKTRRWIHWLKKKKVTVYYWTVNEPELMRTLAERGADGIMSDNPQLIRKALGA